MTIGGWQITAYLISVKKNITINMMSSLKNKGLSLNNFKAQPETTVESREEPYS